MPDTLVKHLYSNIMSSLKYALQSTDVLKNIFKATAF